MSVPAIYGPPWSSLEKTPSFLAAPYRGGDGSEQSMRRAGQELGVLLDAASQLAGLGAGLGKTMHVRERGVREPRIVEARGEAREPGPRDQLVRRALEHLSVRPPRTGVVAG